MTKEELLKPRIKVMADWPRNNIMKVGEIWFFIEGPTGFQDGYYSDNIKGFPTGKVIVPGDIDPHPHLFKKMEWWQDREPAEFPQYVKWTMTERIGQVQKFEFKPELGTIILDGSQMTAGMWLPALVPSDESEYNCQKQ